MLQERSPDGATVHRIDNNLRVILPTLYVSRGDRSGRRPGASSITGTLEEQVQIAACTCLSTAHVVMLVEGIEMTKAIGGDRWLPIIARVETDTFLGTK